MTQSLLRPLTVQVRPERLASMPLANAPISHPLPETQQKEQVDLQESEELRLRRVIGTKEMLNPQKGGLRLFAPQSEKAHQPTENEMSLRLCS